MNPTPFKQVFSLSLHYSQYWFFQEQFESSACERVLCASWFNNT